MTFKSLLTRLSRDVLQYCLEPGEVVVMCEKSFYSYPAGDKDAAQQFCHRLNYGIVGSYLAIIGDIKQYQTNARA